MFLDSRNKEPLGGNDNDIIIVRKYIRQFKLSETLNWSHLKVSSNVKCDSGCGMNHIKDGEVKTEGHHPRAEDNDEGRTNSLVGLKPFHDPITFE
jgi:hypothetical protein